MQRVYRTMLLAAVERTLHKAGHRTNKSKISPTSLKLCRNPEWSSRSLGCFSDAGPEVRCHIYPGLFGPRVRSFLPAGTDSYQYTPFRVASSGSMSGLSRFARLSADTMSLSGTPRQLAVRSAEGSAEGSSPSSLPCTAAVRSVFVFLPSLFRTSLHLQLRVLDGSHHRARFSLLLHERRSKVRGGLDAHRR